MPPADLRAFPSRRVRAGRRFARIHRRAFDARWFCSDLDCRFDLDPPRGTLYLGEEPLGAFLEVFRDVAVVDERDVEQRSLSMIPLPKGVRLADCTVEGARRFGCTGEIHAGLDYELTQRWAAAFAQAGFGGVRYFIRHDPRMRLIGVAVFGAEGEGTMWPEPEASGIPRALQEEAERRFGIRIMPSP